MRKIAKLKLPRWIIRDIKYGKEDEDFSAVVVGIISIYVVSAIAYFVYAPFGREYLVLELIIAITILAFIGISGVWLVSQVAYLVSLRKEALIRFEYSKTEKEREDATSRLEILCVPIPNEIKAA